MNILIVGNGFDLAHGLPTTYMDFLDFMNNSVEYYKDQNFSLHHMSETDVLYGFKKMIDKKKHYGIKEIEVSEFLGDDNGKWLFHPNRQTNYGEIFDEVLKKNSWLTYFNVKKGSIQGGDWIDFELEISNVVKCLEELKKDKMNDFVGVGFKDFDSFELSLNLSDDPDKRMMDLNKIIILLYDELEQFINALEFYMTLINQISLKIQSPDIENNNFNKVLSFNYTNTYSRTYIKNLKDVEFNFIHGKVGEHNLVLGTEETLLNKKDINNEISCIRFKKYFQRIYKKNGLNYKDWLLEPDFVDGKEKKYDVFIFGHSLDITDKDILKDIIKHANVDSTTIYYHNEEKHAQQIANLVKIIGKAELIKRTGDENIIFKRQADMELIQRS